MRHFSERWDAIVVIATVALIAPDAAVRTQQIQTASVDLATLFTPGGVLQDRNGDGAIDFVKARVVLGEKPGASDVSVASDLAARLGFETMAMNLPLTSADSSATVFVIGRDGLQRTGLTPPQALASLAPGDGIVATVSTQGAPAIVVAGADAAGTMAAGSSWPAAFRTSGIPKARPSLRWPTRSNASLLMLESARRA